MRGTKMTVLKRERERKKAEKAALKRAQRLQRRVPTEGDPMKVASRDDLESYGVVVGPGEDANRR